MKVIFINPRSKNPGQVQQKCFPPINLLYLASAIIDGGYPVEVIDANALGLSDEEIIKRIKDNPPALIGIPLFSELLVTTYLLVRRIKDNFPEIEIVLGGPHANALPEKTLEEFSDVDYLIRGEAESSMVSLCRAMENKAGIDQVIGLYYRDNNKIAANPPANSLNDLDKLAHPRRGLLADEYKNKKYYMVLTRMRPVDTIITSRGCSFSCKFCCNTAQEYRVRSPESVLEEIIEIYSCGVRSIDIADANFTFNRAHAMAIFDLIIKENLKIAFRIKSRADSIDRELVRRAKQAGAYLISLGMESGSQDILDRMAKATNLKNNTSACEMVMQEGLKLNTGWIIGFPGETKETINQTLNLIIKIKPTTANIGLLVPYPGTEIYRESLANGSLIGDWSIRSGFIPWVKLPWIDTYADLEEILRQAKNKIYYRPHYMLNFSKEIIASFNLTLARYAFQEACKSFLPAKE